MELNINVTRTKRDFFKEDPKEWAYQGDTIKVNVTGAPDEKLIEEVNAEILRFDKLTRRNTGLYLQKQIRVDWATFKYFAKTYKHVSVSRPNSCFYLTLEFSARRGQLNITSPTLNWDYNSFKD